MKIVVKKTLIALVLSCSMTNFGHAFDIDETVDDEIRKNYNSTQLIDDVGLQDNALEKKIESTATNINVDPNLPSLPTVTNKNTSSTKVSTTAQQYQPYKGGNIRIKSGTTFDVISSGTISDWQVKGNKVTFSLPKAKHGRDTQFLQVQLFKGKLLNLINLKYLAMED